MEHEAELFKYKNSYFVQNIGLISKYNTFDYADGGLPNSNTGMYLNTRVQTI